MLRLVPSASFQFVIHRSFHFLDYIVWAAQSVQISRNYIYIYIYIYIYPRIVMNSALKCVMRNS